MRRRLFAVLLALLLMSQFAGAAAATDIPMSSAAAYYQEETLYAFARFPNYSDPTELQVGLMVNDVQVGPEQTPEPLITAEAPMEYLLLVDCSTSMPVFQDRILALGEALMAQQAATVTVATFGEAFQVVAEGISDAQSLRDTLNGLSFGQQGTDICGGTVYAIDYANKHLWQPGRLVNLILITDGIPFYSQNATTEAESEKAAAAALKGVLAKYPQILLHSLCFDQWEESTYDAVSSGIGYHMSAGNAEEARKVGSAISELCGSLYRLSFPLETYAEDLSLKISNREFITVAPVSNLNDPLDESVLENIPAVIDSEAAPEAGAPEASPEPSEAVPETSETSIVESEQVSEQPETEVPQEAAPAQTPATVEEAVPSQLILMVAGAVVVVLLILLVILLVRRKKKKAAPPQAVSITLRLEVLYGNVSSKKRQFVLTDSLFIGSDSRCDVVLPDAAPLNARVFLQDGTVFIEDLNSPDGTILGGMRIYAPNPLRSREQIMIGQVCFSFSY